MSEPRVATVVSQQGNDLAPLCNAQADTVGMPPRIMVACMIAESDIDERAERWGVWPDVSFGCCQQTVAYAPIGDGSNSAENIAAVRAALFDVATAAAIAAPQLGAFWAVYQDGPETLARYNWPAQGLEGNPNRANIERAWEASAAYVVEAPPDLGGLVYDATWPVEVQDTNWNCACASTAWSLQALGFGVTEAEITAAMVAAGLVSPEWGLHDGSGAQLADWLQDQWGVSTATAYPADWEATLNPWVGVGPVLIGGSAWNHWAAVRRGVPDGLDLANPSESWMGVGSHMSKAEWDALGPFSAIFVDPSYGGIPPEAEVDDTARAYVMHVAEQDILRNVDKALQYDLPPDAREALEFGAKPAATTLAEGNF